MRSGVIYIIPRDCIRFVENQIEAAHPHSTLAMNQATRATAASL